MRFKLFLIFLFSSSIVSGTIFVGTSRAALPWEDGRIHVDVYVVALEGVGTSSIGNVSRVIEGVGCAVKVVNEGNYSVLWLGTETGYGYYPNVSPYIYYDYGEGITSTWLRTEFPVNACVRLVNDWETYKGVIESGQECVVINCHGEVLPIPDDYSKEAWVDKIAEAMLYRNLTWVHVAGYPFYYVWYEGASAKETWGEAGFQQLTKHINKPNITIQHPSADYNMSGLSEAEQYWMKTWPEIHEANEVSADFPLSDSDFDGYIALPIWRSDEYNAGAVVAFKKTANDTSCGFYVHIGTNQTFDTADNPTDADFYRGYVGCAAGLWSLVSRTGRETLIAEAETLIGKALEEDRTEGLSEAYGFLEKAEYFHSHYADAEFLRDVYYTMVAAVKAEKPESNLLPQLLFMSLGVGSVVTIVAVVWHKRRKENDEEG